MLIVPLLVEPRLTLLLAATLLIVPLLVLLRLTLLLAATLLIRHAAARLAMDRAASRAAARRAVLDSKPVDTAFLQECSLLLDKPVDNASGLKISSFANITYASGYIATYDKLVQNHHAAVKGRKNFSAVRACNCFFIIDRPSLDVLLNRLEARAS